MNFSLTSYSGRDFPHYLDYDLDFMMNGKAEA